MGRICNDNLYLVDIRCNTYNQALYIEQTLDGFVMQETTFPFIILLVDDASTDGTSHIISSYIEKFFDLENGYKQEREYGHIFFAKHKQNLNCYIASLFLKENHYQRGLYGKMLSYISEWRYNCKYEALCEGDDYWIDQYKLQKQIDILERNSDVFLVYTAFNNIDSEGNLIVRDLYEDYIKASKSGYIFPELLKRNFILTCTTCFRISTFSNSIFLNCKSNLDYACFLSASVLGKSVFLSERTANYRLAPLGVTNTSKQKIHDLSRMVFIYFSQLYLKKSIKKYGFIDDLKIKIEILIKAIGLFYEGKNKKFILSILSIDKTLFFVIPFACLIAIKRKLLRL